MLQQNIAPRILVFQDRKTYWFAPDDICYLRAQGSYTEIGFINHEMLLVSKNLKHVVGVLPENCNQFCRVHKSWVVNVNHIKQMHNDDSNKYQLTMDDDSIIPIGNPQFRNQLLAHFSVAISTTRQRTASAIEQFTGPAVDGKKF